MSSNIGKLLPNEEEFRNSRFGKDEALKPVAWSIIEQLIEYYQSKHWGKLGEKLTALPDDAMLCGAEINSITSMYKKGYISNLERIIFLVSDTQEGQNIGKTLTRYYQTRSKELGLNQVYYRKVDQLQDESPRDFKINGLRNLVRVIGKETMLAGGHTAVAINATGGYKAQIAIAALIGQALDMPVYYKHELFNEIISFPPMPVALDYDLLGRYGDILAAFERGEALTPEETGPIDEKLLALLEEIKVDNQICRELSPIGQIYLTGFRLRHPRPVDMPEATRDQRSEPSFPQHNYPDSFKQFVNKIWKEVPWITTCYSINYSGQKAIKRTGFYLQEGHHEGGTYYPDRIIGTYKDRDSFKGRFVINTTGSSRQDLVWAVDYLNRHYGAE